MKISFIIVSACLLFALKVQAADAFWISTDNPVWENPENWSDGVVPGSTTNVIFGDRSGLADPFLSTTQQIARVEFQNPGWTISGPGMLCFEASPPYSSSGGGTNIVDVDTLFLKNATISASEDSTLIVKGDVRSDGGRKVFAVGGAGTVRLEGAVSNVKDFRIQSGGTLELAMPVRMNSDFEDRIENGSTIRYFADEQCRIHWPRYGSGGLLDLNGFTQTFSGLTFAHLTHDANFTIDTGEEGKLILHSGIRYQPWDWNPNDRYGTVVIRGNLEFVNNGFITAVRQNVTNVHVRIDAVISGGGGLSCQGSGTVQLTGSNTYPGDTTVARAQLGSRPNEAGLLIIDGTATETSSGIGLGALHVEPSGAVGGAGTIGYTGRTGATLSLEGEFVAADEEDEIEEAVFPATVTPGGIEEGSEIATLSVNGDVDFGDYSCLSIDIGEGTCDTLAVSGSISVSALGTVLQLNIPDEIELIGDYTLAESGELTGEFSSVLINGEEFEDATDYRSIAMTHHIGYSSDSVILKQSPPPGTVITIF
jgi:autotransporter-associated beta strand protein